MGDILVFAETKDGTVKKSAFELVSKAETLAASLGGSVVAVCVGESFGDVAQTLAKYGAKKVVLVTHAKLKNYNTIAFTQVLSTVIQDVKPSVILGSASALGKDFFPRLAARLKVGLASDAVDLRIDGGKLIARKPVLSGKALVDVVFSTAMQIATTRPNSFSPRSPQEGYRAEVVTKELDVGELVNPLVDVIQGDKGGEADLTEAEIIVSGGRAMGNSENFKILRELADTLGATVGASRAAVDSGYASHDMQVGQTGKVVNPKLYIANGISGAIQHLAGMRTSKVIVAVNKDAEAPIFSKADYGIVGNLFTIVPLLTLEFKKMLSG